eukprot:748675-Hanusia_phi.AAC.1
MNSSEDGAGETGGGGRGRLWSSPLLREDDENESGRNKEMAEEAEDGAEKEGGGKRAGVGEAKEQERAESSRTRMLARLMRISKDKVALTREGVEKEEQGFSYKKRGMRRSDLERYLSYQMKVILALKKMRGVELRKKILSFLLSFVSFPSPPPISSLPLPYPSFLSSILSHA